MTKSQHLRTSIAAALTIAFLSSGVAAAGAQPQTTDRTAAVSTASDTFERGPDPTRASIEAQTGSFAITSTVVPNGSAYGFGGGTIYYPTTTSAGTFGAVGIVPGLTGTQANSTSWLGPRLASQGFVVFTIDTTSPNTDQPYQRGVQLNYAMYYLTHYSSVANRIDPTRLAVMGHSMGGGGAFEAAKVYTSYKAIIAMTPYSTDTTWPEITAPSLVIGGENDTVTPVNQHAIPIYNGLTNASEKAYLELRGGTHFTPITSSTTIAAYSIAWLKRYVDNDSRYAQFLCPAPAVDSQVSAYRDTCPS